MERIAFEWQYERDDAAMMNKFHKTMDRLIKFLDDNQNNIAAWKNSTAQQTIRGLFIKDATTFQYYFPIDNSRRFFVVISPFIKEIQEKKIKPALGESEYNALLTKWKEQSTEEADDTLLSYIKPVLAWFTMEMAVKALSIQALPEGVMRRYFTDGKQTQLPDLSGQPVLITKVAGFFETEGRLRMDELQTYLMSIAETSGSGSASSDFDADDYLPTNDSDNAYFRT